MRQRRVTGQNTEQGVQPGAEQKLHRPAGPTNANPNRTPPQWTTFYPDATHCVRSNPPRSTVPDRAACAHNNSLVRTREQEGLPKMKSRALISTYKKNMKGVEAAHSPSSDFLAPLCPAFRPRVWFAVLAFRDVRSPPSNPRINDIRNSSPADEIEFRSCSHAVLT